METQQQTNQVKPQSESHFANLHQITPLSKYLAMALFVVLPFLGGWIGYQYAPDKIVYKESVAPVEHEADEQMADTPSLNASSTTVDSLWGNWSVNENGIVYHKDTPYPQINAQSVRNVGDAYCSDFIADDELIYVVSENAHHATDQPKKLFAIPGADPATFEAGVARSGNCYEDMVGKDSQHVFYGDRVIVGADPQTYKQDFTSELTKFDDGVMRDHMNGETYLIENFIQVSQDIDSVFLRWEQIEEADQDTFKIIESESHNDLFGTLVAEDAQNYYVDFCAFSKTGQDNQLKEIVNSLSLEDTAKPFRMSEAGECVNTGEGYAFSLYPLSHPVD